MGAIYLNLCIASKDFKLIIDFAAEIPKFELFSDEDLGEPEADGLSRP